MKCTGRRKGLLRRGIAGLSGALSALLLAGALWSGGGEASPAVRLETSEPVSLPVLMYHNVLEDGAGGFGEYVISASELEKDLSWLKEAGFSFVTGEDLKAWAGGISPLPEKPVMLTFDDGFESMSAVVLPLLEKYDAKATAAIVGFYTDLYSGDVPRDLSYSHLSWSQAAELKKTGRVEIASHSFDFHELSPRKGAVRMVGEGEETFRKAFCEDILLLQERCRDAYGGEPVTFAYPYGFYTPETESLLKELGFSVTLTCEEGVNTLTGKDSLFGLKRYNRPHGIDVPSWFEKRGMGP